MQTKTDTIVRTTVLAIALLNQGLAIAGRERLPFAEDDIYQFITLLVTAGAALWGWWKNNSFTKRAKQADEYLEMLKEVDLNE